MEKIRSGQPFLYRDGGIQSTVIDVHMKDIITGIYLKKALNTSLLRYPYLTSRLIEKDGDFYLIENKLTFILEETSELHSLGSAEVNYHLIDVTYHGRQICIAFHHGLCDGVGIKPFVQTLLYYYCTFMSERKVNVPGVRLAGEHLLLDETKEPLSVGKLDVDNTLLPEVIKDGYALPDAIIKDGQEQYYRYEIELNQEKFMEFAKENNATPSIIIALLTSKAIKAIYPDADKPILCNLAYNMRKELNLDNTFKNCVNSVYLPYSENMQQLSLKEQSTIFREMLSEQKKIDAVKNDANSILYLCDKLDELDSYEAKKKIMTYFNDINLNTFIISYLGQIKLGEYEKYIDSMHMYNSGTIGLAINMLSVGEKITIDLLQSFETDKYITALSQVLKEVGLEFSVSEKIEFVTPRDSVIESVNLVA